MDRGCGGLWPDRGVGDLAQRIPAWAVYMGAAVDHQCEAGKPLVVRRDKGPPITFLITSTR
ncbi:hypothetical protein [Marivita sp.]|uniref:hypothetical protein n=1 Tax=Marivita sp. TaxID=2003365 RepID=UPI00321BC2B8